MPADIERAEFCADYFATYEVEGSKGGTYLVTLNGGEEPGDCRDKETGEQCPGFKYRGVCRHMRAVWNKACLWNPQWHDGGPDTIQPIDYHYPHVPDGKCPRCGSGDERSHAGR